jgi:hypothetical protein
MVDTSAAVQSANSLLSFEGIEDLRLQALGSDL